VKILSVMKGDTRIQVLEVAQRSTLKIEMHDGVRMGYYKKGSDLLPDSNCSTRKRDRASTIFNPHPPAAAILSECSRRDRFLEET